MLIGANSRTVAADVDAKMAAAQSEADRLRRENDAQRTAAQSELDRIAKEKAQLELDKAELRAQLLLQFIQVA